MSKKEYEKMESDSEGNQQEDEKLLSSAKNESAEEQFLRQRIIAQQCCDLGRKLLTQNDHESATKQFSKAVMTFEFILKHNMKQHALKGQIADMLKSVIVPAYSNLALCYLKSKRYDMVITFTNQVLISDPSNVKNLYRRAVARRHSKAYDEAVQDLEKVIKLDPQMQTECRKMIAECNTLKTQQKKKQKQLAKQFISGYAEAKPEPKPFEQVGPGEEGKKDSLWERSLRCIRRVCPKLFK